MLVVSKFSTTLYPLRVATILGPHFWYLQPGSIKFDDDLVANSGLPLETLLQVLGIVVVL